MASVCSESHQIGALLKCTPLSFLASSESVLGNKICLENVVFDETTCKSHESFLNEVLESTKHFTFRRMKAQTLLCVDLLFIGKWSWDM